MGHDPLFDVLLILAWLWLGMLVCWAWLQGRRAPLHTTPTPAKPIKKRSPELKPFAGLIYKPICAACEHAADRPPKPPSSPPPVFTFTRGRRTIVTQQQFCPDQNCSYYGWTGRGNIRSNGHPGGKPWRQFACVSCHGYFQQTHGTPLHGKRVSPELRVPLAAPEPTNGTGSAKQWRPSTPAMAAGLTDRVWTLREVIALSGATVATATSAVRGR